MPLNSPARRCAKLPHPPRPVHAVIGLVALFFLTCCGEEDFDLTEGQSSLGDIVLPTAGLNASLRPAKVQDLQELDQRIVYRLYAGVAELVVQTDQSATGRLTLALENAHKLLKPRVVRATQVGFNNAFSNTCPALDAPETIECNTMSAPECEAPVIVSGQGTTSPEVAVDLFPCHTITYAFEIDPDRDDEAMEVVVVGATKAPGTITKIVDQQRRLGRETDFFVALGDHLDPDDPRPIEDRIGQLQDEVRRLGEVVVMLPGELEIQDDGGRAFENAFGAFSARWRLKNTHWVSLYSAELETSDQALERLDTLLLATSRQDRSWREEEGVELEPGQSRILPLMGLTYAPPFDPVGPREQGWQSRLQASRVMSLFAQYGTDHLFAGRLPEHHTHGARPPVHIVNSQLDSPRATGSYLRIQLSQASDQRAQQGARMVTVSRVEIDP